MIRNITAHKKVKAVTGIDFFGRLCRAMPREFRHSAESDTKIYGYYTDKFDLVCYKQPAAASHEESYLFKMEKQPDSSTPTALADFFNDIRHVAEKAGYEEVATHAAMFSDSYCLMKEAPNLFRVLVRH